MFFQIHQDCAIVLSLSNSPIVHAQDPDRWSGKRIYFSNQPEQSIRTHRQFQFVTNPCSCFHTHLKSKNFEQSLELNRSPGVEAGRLWDPFSKSPMVTSGIAAKIPSY